MNETTTKTLRFWLRDISKADFKDLHELSRAIGSAHRVFVETWLRLAFEGEVSPNDRFKLARRAFQAAMTDHPYILRLSDTYALDRAQKDIKRQWGEIRKGAKCSVSFGPGKLAWTEWEANSAANPQCTVEETDGHWYMANVAIRKNEGAAVREARRWELVPQVSASRKVRAWRGADMIRQLGKATKISRVRLVWKDRGWEAQVVVALPVDVSKAEDECACGVDVGMRHLLVASIPSRDTCLFWGREECARLWDELDRSAAQRNALYKAGKRHAAETRSDKCSRLRKHICELASRRFVDWCVRNRVTVVRMEDLTGIRRTTDDRLWNRRLSHWPWFFLQQRIEQKLAAVNIAVEKRTAAGTSQTCSACGYRDAENRNGAAFKCLKCGYERHADLNAANNIAEPEDSFAVATPNLAGLRSGEVGRNDGLSRATTGSAKRLRRANPEPCAQGVMTL